MAEAIEITASISKLANTVQVLSQMRQEALAVQNLEDPVIRDAIDDVKMCFTILEESSTTLTRLSTPPPASACAILKRCSAAMEQVQAEISRYGNQTKVVKMVRSFDQLHETLEGLRKAAELLRQITAEYSDHVFLSLLLHQLHPSERKSRRQPRSNSSSAATELGRKTDTGKEEVDSAFEHDEGEDDDEDDDYGDNDDHDNVGVLPKTGDAQNGHNGEDDADCARDSFDEHNDLLDDKRTKRQTAKAATKYRYSDIYNQVGDVCFPSQSRDGVIWHPTKIQIDTRSKYNIVSRELLKTMKFRGPYDEPQPETCWTTHGPFEMKDRVTLRWGLYNSTQTQQSRFYIVDNPPFEMLVGTHVIQARNIMDDLQPRRYALVNLRLFGRSKAEKKKAKEAERQKDLDHLASLNAASHQSKISPSTGNTGIATTNPSNQSQTGTSLSTNNSKP